MSRSPREKAKGRRESGPYLALPMTVLRSPQFGALSSRAVKALVSIGSQYRGNNNGDLSAAFSVMQSLGWRSRDQLAKALTELVESGFLLVTRRGGNRVARLYALTFAAIDLSDKYDDGIKATVAPPGIWKNSRTRTAGHNGPAPRVITPDPDAVSTRTTGHNSPKTHPVSTRTAGPFLDIPGGTPEKAGDSSSEKPSSVPSSAGGSNFSSNHWPLFIRRVRAGEDPERLGRAFDLTPAQIQQLAAEAAKETP